MILSVCISKLNTHNFCFNYMNESCFFDICIHSFFCRLEVWMIHLVGSKGESCFFVHRDWLVIFAYTFPEAYDKCFYSDKLRTG